MLGAVTGRFRRPGASGSALGPGFAVGGIRGFCLMDLAILRVIDRLVFALRAFLCGRFTSL